MFTFNLKSILIRLFSLLLIFSMISFLSITYYYNDKYSFVNLNAKHNLRLNKIKNFMITINKNRLNDFFSLLSIKESDHDQILERLNLISFRKLINGDYSNEIYKTDIEKFLDIDPKSRKISVNDKFVRYLNNKSEYFSFQYESSRKKETQEFSLTKNPVFLIAANKKYYQPLKEIITNIKFYFPSFLIYIYLLEQMNDSLINNIQNLCNNQCKLVKFDSDNLYKNTSPHVNNLITYSWKPLIIQEVLKNHDDVIYVDTSIRFKSNNIDYLLKTLSERGIITRYIDLYLSCFTNPDMFKWFNQSVNLYENVYSLEANFIMLNKRNFVTHLIMKAWVTCALDEDCISPKGSHIYGSFNNWIFGCNKNNCGCHRFDQDALSIITTYFYGFPQGFYYKPSIALKNSEMFLIEVNRRNVLTYVFDQIKLLNY